MAQTLATGKHWKLQQSAPLLLLGLLLNGNLLARFQRASV